MTTEPAEAGQRQPGDLGQQILGSQQLYDLLVSKISDVAVERMEAQHNRTRNRTAIFLTLLIASLTGIATFGFTALQESIKDQAVTEAKRAATQAASDAVVAVREAAIEAAARTVPNAVADAVRQQVGAAQDAWTRLSEATELAALPQRFEQKKSFTQDEANRALDILTRLSNNDAHKSIPQFETVLEQIIDIFQAADRDDLVARLEPMYKNIMSTHIGIIYTMVESLGRKLASFPAPPDQLGNSRMRSEWDTLIERYIGYAAAARQQDYPEWPYPYDLILTTMENDSPVIVNARLALLQDFSPDERKKVIETFMSLATGSWRVNGIDAMAALVIERTVDVLEHMSDDDQTYTLQEVLVSVKSEGMLTDSGASAELLK